MKKAVTALLLLALCSCQGGPDIVRYKAESSSYTLAKRCADGWFQGLPFVPNDAEIVYKALDDWDGRLAADAKLLGVVR